MRAVNYSSANSVLNWWLRFIVLTRLIHVCGVKGRITGCCYYLGYELPQWWGDVVCLGEKTDISPRKGKVGRTYFLFDILFERADQKEICDLRLVYINPLLIGFFFFEACVLCSRNETNTNNCPDPDLEINYWSIFCLKGICFVYISITVGMYAVEKQRLLSYLFFTSLSI